MLAARPLPGLPPYGPPALSFPDSDAFREGFVVEFTTSSGEMWTGNFAGFDAGGTNSIHSELGPNAVVIVAGSAGYIVDAERRHLIREMGIGITHLWFENDLQAMIVTNGLWFEAFTADRMLWRSRRFSWDGIRKLERDALTVTGEAYDPTYPQESWTAFCVNLETGQVEGGSYTGPEM
jgi:hypothetical protein